MCYAHSEKLGVSMTNAGIAYATASGIIAIWMFMLVTRVPFLDVQYRGVLKFQFKKLSPIRWKLVM